MADTLSQPDFYSVEYQRDRSGRLVALAVLPRDSGPVVAIYDEDDDQLDRILRLARQEERSDPHSDKLPSDRAIIMAALRDLDLLAEDA